MHHEPVRSAGGATAIIVSGATPDTLETYRDLCARGISATPQGSAWVEQWTAHAKSDGLIAIAVANVEPMFALALDVQKVGPFRIARFMGGRHANGNFPATDSGFLARATAKDMQAVVDAIRDARPDIDIISLERFLPDLAGYENPLSRLPHMQSPNLALSVGLHGGFETLLARVSGKRKRKKHRSQMRKYEAAGGFRRIEAKTPGETRALLDAFFAMKEQRFRKMGIRNVFAEPGVQPFFHALFADALGDRPPAFVLHGLEVAGTLRAVTGSSRCGDRLICEFGAIVEDDLSHASPGDFLFFDNIEEACEAGCAVYDFSVGDEPYKRTWCDTETRHFDVVLPLTAKGRILATAMRLQSRLKAFAKNSPTIWRLTRLLRKRVAAQTQASDD